MLESGHFVRKSHFSSSMVEPSAVSGPILAPLVGLAAPFDIITGRLSSGDGWRPSAARGFPTGIVRTLTFLGATAGPDSIITLEPQETPPSARRVLLTTTGQPLEPVTEAARNRTEK